MFVRKITHAKWQNEHQDYTGMYYAYAMLQENVRYSKIDLTVPILLPQIKDSIQTYLDYKPRPEKLILPDLDDSVWLIR